MIDNAWFEEGFSNSPYMGILRGLGTERTLELSRAAWDNGVELVEVPVQRPEDLEVLRMVAAEGARLGHAVGAGTVRSVDAVAAVREAGARFIVSPGFSPAIATAAAALGMPPLPGVSTASEVDAALSLGLTWVKAFPAVALGSVWIRQMHGPFPEARFIATGGMDLEVAEEYLAAGARGIAIGSAIEQLAASR